MAFNNKPSFAVSVTPKGTLAEVNATNVAMTVMHENIRKTLGGSGEITSSGNTIGGGSAPGAWADGVNTPISSDGGEIPVTTSTELVCIKHTGILVASGNCDAAADRVQICLHGDDTANLEGDGVIIAELFSGEAMVIPRPGLALTYILAKVGAAVNIEVTTIGT